MFYIYVILHATTPRTHTLGCGAWVCTGLGLHRCVLSAVYEQQLVVAVPVLGSLAPLLWRAVEHHSLQPPRDPRLHVMLQRSACASRGRGARHGMAVGVARHVPPRHGLVVSSEPLRRALALAFALAYGCLAVLAWRTCGMLCKGRKTFI